MKIIRLLSSLLTSLALVLGACGGATETGGSGGPVRVADYTETIRVACVGDSITFGATIEDYRERAYPPVLGGLLGEQWVVRNFGVSAATMLRQGDWPYRDQEAFREVTAWDPHVVVIKLGTNDSKPQNWDAEAFEADYAAMIAHFSGLPAQPRILLCLPVPAFEDRWGITEAVIAGEVIPVIRRLAAAHDLPLLDLHAALAGRPELFPDGIHPDAEGARLIAESVKRALTGENS